MRGFKVKLPKLPAADARDRVREALELDNPELAAREFEERDRSRALMEAGDAFAQITLTEEDRALARRMMAKRKPAAEPEPEAPPPPPRRRRRFRLWG